jgi:hypothetical protein
MHSTPKNQLCYYCKENQAEFEYKNTEFGSSSEMKFHGFHKHLEKTTKTKEVVRCKRCFENHEKVDVIISKLYFIYYIVIYVLIIYFFYERGKIFPFIISLFLSIFPTFIFVYISALFVGEYYLKKYKIGPRWSRGGDVL